MDRLANKGIIMEAITTVRGCTPKEKTCDCIIKIEKRIAQEHNADLAQIEHFGSQCSEVSYRHLKEGSIVYKRAKYTSVDWKFCPFCGKQIKVNGFK